MASFTDSIQGLTNYSPYIQQQPVEEMSKIGMIKQGQYNEGVQRIQTQIDNVAGMDVIRDVDKQYLQSKLSSLGTNLKTVAAGDFSNFQLVNSVGGMINSIGKDQNVQNAVMSTQRVRKGQQNLEIAKKEGKSSIQNEEDWNSQVSNWLGNTDLKTTFRGDYTPYTDLTEKYNNVYKNLKESSYSYDVPYKTDANGNPLYFTEDKNGNLIETTKDKGHVVVDDAMKRISKKGIDAHTILENFYSNTTENDKRQMIIDARYHYKNATLDTFRNDIVGNFALTQSQLQEKENVLKLDINAGNIAGEEKAKKQAELGRVQLAITELPTQQMKLLRDLQDPSNLDSFKIDTYTQKFLTELARDKATQDVKEEILNNPYMQSEMAMKRFDFDIKKENESIRQFNKNYSRGVYEFDTLQEEKAQAKLDKQGSTPVTHSGGNRTDVELPTATKLSDEITGLDKQLKYNEAEFLSKNRGFDKGFLDSTVNNYRNSPDKANIQDPDIMEYVENRIAMEDQLRRKEKLQKAASALTIDLDVKINNVLQNTKGLTDTSGNEIYSATQLVDNKQRVKDFYDKNKENPNILRMISVNFGDSPIVSAVTKKLISDKTAIARYNFYGQSDPMLGFDPIEKKIVNTINDIESHISSTLSPLVKERNKIQSDFLATKLPEYDTVEGTLDVNNEHDMTAVTGIISDAINTDVPGEINKKTLDPATYAKWVEDAKISKNINYKLTKNFDGSGELMIQHSTDVPQKIPISKQRMADSFPRYVEKSIMDNINDKLIQSTEGTTNSWAKKDPRTASSGNELPLIKGAGLGHLVRWDVEGTASTAILDANGKSTGQTTTPKYVIRLYVFDENKKVWHDGILSNAYYHDATTLQEKLNGIGTEAIKYILNK